MDKVYLIEFMNLPRKGKPNGTKWTPDPNEKVFTTIRPAKKRAKELNESDDWPHCKFRVETYIGNSRF